MDSKSAKSVKLFATSCHRLGKLLGRLLRGTGWAKSGFVVSETVSTRFIAVWLKRLREFDQRPSSQANDTTTWSLLTALVHSIMLVTHFENSSTLIDPAGLALAARIVLRFAFVSFFASY